MFNSDEDNDGCSGSRVDAPQKSNCRSPVQVLERQGLRRHCPLAPLCAQSYEMEIPSLVAGL
jgi:hypothetical protein